MVLFVYTRHLFRGPYFTHTCIHIRHTAYLHRYRTVRAPDVTGPVSVCTILGVE